MKTTDTQTPKLLKSIGHVLFVAGFAALFAQFAQAQTPLPIYEPFPASYTNGTADETVLVPATGATSYPARRLRNGTTATMWSIGGAAGGGSTLVVGGPAILSYPGLYQDTSVPSVGVYVRTNVTTANRTAGILFPTINAGSVYASFLLDVQQNPALTNRCLVKFETATNSTGSTGGSGAMAGVFLTASGELGLSKSSTTVVGITNGAVLSAGTHLVVTRYTFNSGVDDDEVALWVDPGSLNAPSGGEPAPSLTWTTGTDVPSISSFYIQAPQNGPPQVPASFFLDELRIATNWAAVTPTQALCTTVTIATPPANQNVSEGISGVFSVVAGGSAPTFQWQLSTNSGSNWSNVIGATSPSYQTPPTAVVNNGSQYRAIVTVPCNGSSATSSVAVLTVNAALKTTNGVVVDDVFQDGLYNNLPYGASNSVWFASTASTLDASSGTYMLATSQASSVTWLGFFTDDQNGTNLPVHLDVGKALKATLVFKANNIVTNNGNFRIGLFDYADGGTRPTADGSTVANSGVNVRGYMTTLNFGTNFTGNPFSLYARNNLVADLMGTTGNFLNLGGGPAGYSGTPAFQNATTYTAEFTVARKGVSSVDFTTRITGGGTNWVFTSSDTNYSYPRFDSIAIRSASAVSAADSFEFYRLLVEVQTAPVDQVSVPPFSITAVQATAPGTVKLTWGSVSGATYHVLSRDSLSTGTWTTNATVIATSASTSYTNSPIPGSVTERYYRVFAPPYTP